jgi:4'-phosphopantetheinyl transferase
VHADREGRAVGAAPRTPLPGLPGAGSGAVWGERALPAGRVEVWAAFVGELDEAQAALQFEQVLSAQERARHGRFVFEKDRRRYLLTRSLVRYVLSRYVPLPPAAWRFEATAFGRPMVADPHPVARGLNFNISHSDRVVLLGVTRERELGIDVEDLLRPAPLEIADSYFAPAEVRQLRALAPELQPRRFLDVWTLKESYIKARGQGLSLPLDRFAFHLEGNRSLRVHFDAELDESPRRWSFWQWNPSPDSIAALCVQNQAGVAADIRVRHVVPFVHEQDAGFEPLRSTIP